jgi:hypothetical protein
VGEKSGRQEALVGKTEGKSHLKDLRVDGKIILNKP